nr:MAG TPA: hypothetical protein [Caudoviricetes sp.]
MSRIFAKFATFAAMNVCSDIRKVASIRRASDIRKDIRSHIRKVFSPWPHSQGFAAADIRRRIRSPRSCFSYSQQPEFRLPQHS